MSKFFLCIIFITKDRKSHLLETHLILCVHFYYLYIYFFSAILVRIDDLSYTRGYEIRGYDYKNKNTKWKYHREKLGIRSQTKLYPSNKPQKKNFYANLQAMAISILKTNFKKFQKKT